MGKEKGKESKIGGLKVERNDDEESVWKVGKLIGAVQQKNKDR